VVNHHSAPWFFYFLVVPIGFAPWSVYLPVAIARLRVWQRRSWQQQPRSAQLGLFALIWFAVVFGFFTIAVTKLPSYTIPLLPAAAILTALFWSEQMTRQGKGGVSGSGVSHVANGLLLVGLTGATLYCTHWMGDDPEMPDLPESIERSGLLLTGAAIWGMGAIAALILLLRRQRRWLWSVNLISLTLFVLLVLIPATLLMDSQRQLPLRQMAATIVQVQQPTEPVVMIGFAKPSLVFYTQRPILYFEELEEVPKRLQKLANQRPKPPSILVIGRTRKLDKAGLLDLNRYSQETIAEAAVYRLLRVHLPKP
jgi:4-amino-4-deoxy-L-arabinose transferase-like glycosyltransferase